MTFNLPITDKDHFKAVLMAANIPLNLNLSGMEIDIIACILRNNIKTIDSEARYVIRKELDKDKFNTNNYIIRLRDKGLLLPIRDSKLVALNPKVYEIVKDKEISFKFTTAV